MSAGAFEDDGDAVIEMDLLPPRWMDIQDEVEDTLKDITLKAVTLDKLHSKHVLPGFDDEDIKHREEVEIEKLTQDITRGFQQCQRAIKRVEKMVQEARDMGTLAKGDEVMARNVQVALAARVQDVSATFRKKQSNYLNSKVDREYKIPILTHAQNYELLEGSSHLSASRRPFRILTQTRPSWNLMRINHSRRPHYNKLHRSVLIVMIRLLLRENRRSTTSPKALLNWLTSFGNYKEWSSTKEQCWTASIIMWKGWL